MRLQFEVLLQVEMEALQKQLERVSIEREKWGAQVCPHIIRNYGLLLFITMCYYFLFIVDNLFYC